MVSRRERVLLSWSSGKDSAYSLCQLRTRSDVEVVGLLTTVEDSFSRVPFHGASSRLVEAQALRCGLPVMVVQLPPRCTDSTYKERMADAFETSSDLRVDSVAFGDIFLEDIRKFREQLLADCGLRARFPLWGRDTGTLATEIIDVGIQATVSAVDETKLTPDWIGRAYDHEFLEDLPADIDPCGENGEFHTVVHSAPCYRESVSVRLHATAKVGRHCAGLVDLLDPT